MRISVLLLALSALALSGCATGPQSRVIDLTNAPVSTKPIQPSKGQPDAQFDTATDFTR